MLVVQIKCDIQPGMTHVAESSFFMTNMFFGRQKGSELEAKMHPEGHNSDDDEDSSHLSKPVPLPYRASRLFTDADRCDESGWTVRFNNASKSALDIYMADKWAPLDLVFCVAFSADGQYLAVGGRSGSSGLTCIYNVQTGKQIK